MDVKYTFSNPQLISYLKKKSLTFSDDEQMFDASAYNANSCLKQFDRSLTSKDLRTRRANVSAVQTLWEDSPETLKNFFEEVTENTQNTASIAQKHYVYP